MYTFFNFLKSIKYLWRYSTYNISYAFNEAIYYNDTECIGKLLKYGIDPNKQGQYNHRPIAFAITIQNIDIVETLLNYGVDINYDRDYGSSILHLAAAINTIDIVIVILDRYPELINACDCSQDTPIHIAALNGNTDIIKVLLDNGADINSMNYLGQTPVENAVLADYVDVVEYLLDSGARGDGLEALVLPHNQAMLDVLRHHRTYQHLVNMEIGLSIFDINQYLKTEHKNIKGKCNLKQLDDKISIFKKYVHSIQLAKQYKDYSMQDDRSDQGLIDLLYSKYYCPQYPSSVIKLKVLVFFEILKNYHTNDMSLIDTLPQTLNAELQDVIELLGES